jgi:serine/threonine protein kinase
MTAPADPAAPDPAAPSGSLELGGLDAHQLLKIGLDTVVMPQGLDPDPDATIAAAGPRPSQPAAQVELPLPEELTDLLPHGNYSVEGFLGQGGMGAVYQGTQVRLQRHVAIKIMRRDSGKDYDFEERFRREALAMAKLNHPNIVSVIDFGEAGPDYLYIVMELVDGADMMDVIRTGTMTQEMALTLLPQICDALQFAHQHGIVHRDIKPSNIMLTRDGRVKMCDFGLAKRYDADSGFRTQTGTGMGTPDYAAPEQFDPSAQIDHRADIYALGVMIYQMITGQLPRGVWKAPSLRSECAPQWDSIVSRAMQSDPADRYQQASEVKTDVSSITLVGSRARQNVDEATEAAPPHALASAATKSRAPLLFGIVGLAAVIALGAFFGLRPESSQVSRDGGNVAGMTPTDHALASAATPARTPSPEPTAIKLWDSAEKLPKQQGVSWEDNALRLDGAGLFLPNTLARDSFVRASVRMNPDAKNPILTLRRSPTRKNTEYQASINASAGKIVMERVVDDIGQCLSEWPCHESMLPPNGSNWSFVPLAMRSRSLPMV